jgi:hypothetical protein
LWTLRKVSEGRHKILEGYIRAEEIGKRFDGWAMARETLGVLDGRKSEIVELVSWLIVHDQGNCGGGVE